MTTSSCVVRRGQAAAGGGGPYPVNTYPQLHEVNARQRLYGKGWATTRAFGCQRRDHHARDRPITITVCGNRINAVSDSPTSPPTGVADLSNATIAKHPG
jgi:hypothetical protein